MEETQGISEDPKRVLGIKTQLQREGNFADRQASIDASYGMKILRYFVEHTVQICRDDLVA